TQQHVIAGRRVICVLFTYRPLPCQCYLAIAGCRRGIYSRDPVIDICSRQWQH
ncbi:unnamed protein product, partial [Staurois parvus]